LHWVQVLDVTLELPLDQPLGLSSGDETRLQHGEEVDGEDPLVAGAVTHRVAAVMRVGRDDGLSWHQEIQMEGVTIRHDLLLERATLLSRRKKFGVSDLAAGVDGQHDYPPTHTTLVACLYFKTPGQKNVCMIGVQDENLCLAAISPLFTCLALS